ncbi:MAG: sterol desaturase family protein [Acidihalobacter sp.]|uniref:sterol desaturase family protein n=1 Tax=Acidihalobacter sp. TaxID=1872108 RepID=UPI00307D98F8
MHSPLHALLDGGERLFWGYLLASAAIALLLSLHRGQRLTLARAKAYFWSADAQLDYRYFLFNWLIKALLIALFVVSAQSIALWTLDVLNAYAEPPFLPWRYRHIVLAYTLTLFVAGDLSRYWLHRLMHANRWLWQFHKVHHSAESLNPFTYYRLHPVENMLFALRHAMVVGAVTGGFVFCFGACLDLYPILGSNLFIVALFAFTSNLRHSHIRLGYGRWLEYLLVSPAQHQAHHDLRHMRRSFGSALALWDWLFGTLTLSRNVERTHRFGLGRNQRERYDSVTKLIVRPFQDIRTRMRRTVS